MTTLRQIEANQRNARKSTGPKTPEGKAASSRNGIKSGIHSNAAVLPSEDRAVHQAFVARYYARFRPTRREERVYIDDIIHCEWVLRRLRRAESELNSHVHESCSRPDQDYPLGQPAAADPKLFPSLQRRINATRKALKEAFAGLRSLRSNSIPDSVADAPETKHTTPPELGLVFETDPEFAPEPARDSACDPTAVPLPPSPSHAIESLPALHSSKLGPSASPPRR